MTEPAQDKRNRVVATLLLVAGFIPLGAGLIDWMQGEGIRWIAFAAGFLLILVGVTMRRRQQARPEHRRP